MTFPVRNGAPKIWWGPRVRNDQICDPVLIRRRRLPRELPHDNGVDEVKVPFRKGRLMPVENPVIDKAKSERLPVAPYTTV
jgi:hypothetical protein